MYPSQQPKILVRPRSSLSNEEHRLKPPLESKTLRNRSIIILSLIGTCIFLFGLCVCLITVLVLVGKNFANSSSAEEFSSGNVRIAKAVIKINESESDNLYEESAFDRNKQYQKPKIIFRPNNLLNISIDDIENNNQTIVVSEVSKTADPIQFHSNFVLAGNQTAGFTMSKFLQNLSFRLPKEILPKYYNLFLNPNLNDKTFSGNITINFNVLKEIPFVPIHSKKLTITEPSIYQINDNGEKISIPIEQSYVYDKYEYWVMEFGKPLGIGEYQVNLVFTGSLTDRIVGFYQSSYLDSKTNSTRWIATSKFEPTFARQAFPCFDEPDKKAKFKVTLARPKDGDYHALSNMDIKNEKASGDSVLVEFEESVEMSTYLACFIVSDFKFEKKEIDTKGIGKTFDMRVYATPEQVNKVDFALETGAKITEYYIQYFKIPYPLPKLDMAAIPDFVSGAMEHWGLVTFRETSLLYDEKLSSTANKQRVGSVVAHELAHMWFGNLVTMKWWNDLWLNEGFASYIQYKGLHNVYKDWGLMEQFLIDTLHGVLTLDATLASHPIVQTVESPDQITELFDSITYSKGASIIRMLEDFVEPEKFQQAVHEYLKEFSFKNAVTDDLLTHIDSLHLQFDVKYIMKTWTEQMGFPVVNVEKITDTDYKLTQKRFFSNPKDENNVNDSEFNYKWYIHITYITSESKDVQRLWFSNSDSEANIKLDKSVDWIKLNYDQTGYYRVNYDQDMWKSITEALKDDINVMSTADRAHLLNDAFALADATQINYDIPLELTKYLSNETEYVPWSVASSNLGVLKRILSKTDISNVYLSYAQQLIEPIYKDLNWEEEKDHLKNLLRVKILSTACSMEFPKCLLSASTLFINFLKTGEKPIPDFREIVYYYGLATTNDEKAWDKVWELFLNEQDAQEKSKLMYGLSGIKDSKILRRFIDLAYDQNNVRSQDYLTCIQNIAANPIGESLVWDYVRENWLMLVDRFGLNERNLGNMIPSITGRFATKVRLQEMEDFFKRYPEAGAGTAARKRALAKVRYNIEWLQNNEKNITDWLKTYY